MPLKASSALTDDQDKKQVSFTAEEIRANCLQCFSPSDAPKSPSPVKKVPTIKTEDIMDLLSDDSDDDVVILDTPPAWASKPSKNKTKKRSSKKSAAAAPKQGPKVSLSPGFKVKSKTNSTYHMITPKIPEGGSVQVRKSSGSTYTLDNVGGVYSCSCPAWKIQKKPINNRTCKHLIQYLGEEFANQVSKRSVASRSKVPKPPPPSLLPTAQTRKQLGRKPKMPFSLART